MAPSSIDLGKTPLASRSLYKVLFLENVLKCIEIHFRTIYKPGPVFTKGLSQGLGLKLRLLSQVSAQKLLRLLS